MIRRLLICIGVLTVLAAVVLTASHFRQFGHIGEWRTIGLRQGMMYYVWRPEALSDAPGFFVDDDSAVNRAMYSIGQGVKWKSIDAWFWVVSVAATVAYSLVLPAVLRRWPIAAPRWLTGSLFFACLICAGLWTASLMATTTYEGTHVHFRLEEGSGKLFLDRNGGFTRYPSYGSGWNVYRPFPPLKLGMSGYINYRNGYFELRIPLGGTLVFLGITTIVLLWQKRSISPGLCRNCLYDLRGNTTGTCPECGTEFVSSDQQ